MKSRMKLVGPLLIALVVFVVTRASGFDTHVDLHMEDELRSYLATGRDLVRDGSLPILSYSPVSSTCYGLISLLPLGSWYPTDVMYTLSAVAAPVALWWALRTVLPAPLGLAVAAWYGSSTSLLQADREGIMAFPHVYAFTSMLVAGAGRDAKFVVEHIARRRQGREGPGRMAPVRAAR